MITIIKIYLGLGILLTACCIYTMLSEEDKIAELREEAEDRETPFALYCTIFFSTYLVLGMFTTPIGILAGLIDRWL